MTTLASTKVTLYQVGGSVRDEYLGVPCYDRDYSAVVADGGWPELLKWAEEYMDDVFLVTPEFLTIRGKKDGDVIDIVMARKEGEYSDGRHPDEVEPGTLEEDLARRDFTMNAMAKSPEGLLIDPFNGVDDIDERVIRCVGSTADRFREDALRAVRAMRFSITKGFTMDQEIREILQSNFMYELTKEREQSIVRNGGKASWSYNDRDWLSYNLKSVSPERVREELRKMFIHNPIEAGTLLFGNRNSKDTHYRDTYTSDSFNIHQDVLKVLFPQGGLWLEPTLKLTCKRDTKS
jgi:tRNA nucleotidyltransferase/poly(A) polymerase